MQRIVIVTIQAIATDKPYAYDDKMLSLLGQYQINLDSKAFNDASIRRLIKQVGEEIIEIRR